jgi:hypothetical protein
MEPASDIILPYRLKLSGTQRLLLSTFCALGPPCAGLGAWARYRFNSTHDPADANWTWFYYFVATAVLLTPMAAMQIYSSIRHLKSSGRVLLDDNGVTFPAGVSMRDLHLTYAEINRLCRKSLQLHGSAKRMLGSTTVLQLFHSCGKKVILLNMLKDRADAELLIRTLEKKTGLVCENPSRPPSLPGIRNNFLP